MTPNNPTMINLSSFYAYNAHALRMGDLAG